MGDLTNTELMIVLDSQPCGCPACDAGVQPGHLACKTPANYMQAAEQMRLVFRAYDNGAWRWYTTPEREETLAKYLTGR